MLRWCSATGARFQPSASSSSWRAWAAVFGLAPALGPKTSSALVKCACAVRGKRQQINKHVVLRVTEKMRQGHVSERGGFKEGDCWGLSGWGSCPEELTFEVWPKAWEVWGRKNSSCKDSKWKWTWCVPFWWKWIYKIIRPARGEAGCACPSGVRSLGFVPCDIDNTEEVKGLRRCDSSS